MVESAIKEPLGTLIHPDEWLELDIEAEPAIIENILPAQVGQYILVSGRTGIGKSILMLNLLYSLGTGSPFFSFECRQTRAGLLIMEGDRNNLQDRIRKVKEQYPHTDNIALDLRLEPKPLEKNLDDYKKVFRGCEVVMLDNLRQVTTAERLKNEYASQWIDIFHKFLTELGAVGILTHHIKKPNSNSLIEPGDVYELKGASEYVDDAATVILLERQRQQRSIFGQFMPLNPNEVTLYFAKSRIANRTLEPIKLTRNYETAGFDPVAN
ncbi:AAA family ATPase [Chloroflexota bacterium]